MQLIEQNVRRILRHHGMEHLVSITRTEADRVWAWPDQRHSLLLYMIHWRWFVDPSLLTKHFKGAVLAFREPARPSLQAAMHADLGTSYCFEIDIDHAPGAPERPLGLLRHGAEVVWNWLSRSKTDQEKIARELDKRFGQEV